MFQLLLRPLHLLARAFLEADSPRELAAGFSLGMLLGLIPKGNLLAAGLALALVVARVNLTTGLCAAFVFSWVGLLADPFTHHLGEAALTAGALEGFWTFVYHVPLARWTEFHNTVVLGNLLLGLALCYPLYRWSLPLCERHRARVVERLKRWRLVQLLAGAEWTASWNLS